MDTKMWRRLCCCCWLEEWNRLPKAWKSEVRTNKIITAESFSSWMYNFNIIYAPLSRWHKTKLFYSIGTFLWSCFSSLNVVITAVLLLRCLFFLKATLISAWWEIQESPSPSCCPTLIVWLLEVSPVCCPLSGLMLYLVWRLLSIRSYTVTA